MKAEYIGKCRDRNGYSVHLFYRYRGHEYMITDGHNGYSESLTVQHKQEQNRIDAMITAEENKQENKAKQTKAIDSALRDLWNEWEN